MERNFLLSGLSFAHGTKDMTKTYAALLAKMNDPKWRPNHFQAGRKSEYVVPDMISRGMEQDGLEAMDVEVDNTGDDEITADAEDIGTEGQL